MRINRFLINLLRNKKTKEDVENCFSDFKIKSYKQKAEYIRYVMNTQKIFCKNNACKNYELTLKVFIELQNKRNSSQKESEENIDYISWLEKTNDLTPLLQAIAIKQITAKVGFDFLDVESALVKLDEEINEVKEAINNKDKDNMFEEIGDALFMLANVAEKIGVAPEKALKESNKKFIARFKHVTKMMQEANIPMNKNNIDKMEVFWQKAKRKGGM